MGQRGRIGQQAFDVFDAFLVAAGHGTGHLDELGIAGFLAVRQQGLDGAARGWPFMAWFMAASARCSTSACDSRIQPASSSRRDRAISTSVAALETEKRRETCLTTDSYSGGSTPY
jgi:hypothetical protein